MKFNWRQTTEIIALLSVVVSLLFVGFELRMNREVASTDSAGTGAAVSPEIINLIATHPSIWMRGCADEELTKEEEMVFGGLVRAVDRHLFFRFLRARDGILELDPFLMARDVARLRANFPGFDRKWKEIRSTYSNEGAGVGFEGAIEQGYELLSRTVEPNMYDSSLCGLSVL